MTTVRTALKGTVELAKAMGVTFKHLFETPVTVNVPDEPVAVFPRFRGRHELRKYDNGLERCIGCQLCEAACPTNAILVEAAENSENDRHSPGERYAKVYEINLLRCMFCGDCEDACPTEAIVLGHDMQLATYERRDLILTKEELLKPTTPNVVVRPDA